MTQQRTGVSVVVPAGVLGGGIAAEQVAFGIAQGAVAVAVDAGSTDSGPSCLATGISKVSRDAIRRDLRAMMQVAMPARVPILIGSCGTSGTDMGVDWTLGIVRDLAHELRLEPRIALLHSEQDKAVLSRKLAEGRLHPLEGAPPLERAVIEDCDHIVALMGPEPYMRALRDGADIILGGRTTDTAILAAMPLLRGADPAHAWHAAKTAECGGLCTENPRGGGVLFTVFQDCFEIRPLVQGNRCTPESVSAHMLYENADPFRLFEPGGVLDVTESIYTQIDEAGVRVTRSRWEKQPYTMKLEGASSGPFQTIMLIGIEDPEVLANLELFLSRMQQRLNSLVTATFPNDSGWELSFRPYGWNAVSNLPVPEGFVPREIGLLLVVTAPTQDLATRIAKAVNSTFFHFPLRPGIPLPSYAFPFSPAEIERGQVYEFRLNHIVEVDDPMELVRYRLLPAEGDAA